MRKVYLKFILIGLAYLTATPSALAEDGGGSQFGVLYGISVPDSDNSSAHNLFGIKGTAGIATNFSIGGYYFIAGSELGSGGDKFDYSLHGLEMALQLPGGAGATFVAFRAGITKVITDSNGLDIIFSPYHYGFASGYNYGITSWFTVGFEGSFLYAEQSTTTKSGTPYELDSFSVLTFLLSIQFKL